MKGALWLNVACVASVSTAHGSDAPEAATDADDCSIDNSKRCQVVETLDEETGEMQTQLALKWVYFNSASLPETAAQRRLAKTRRNKRLRQIKLEDEDDWKSLPPLREHQPSSSDALLGGPNKHDFGTFIPDDDHRLVRRKAIQQREMRLFPLKFIVPLVLSWLVVLIQSMLCGGHGAPSIIGLTFNSVDYWMITILPLLILVAITL